MTEEDILDLETELLAGASPRDAALVCDQDPAQLILIMHSDSPLGVRFRKAEAKAKTASIRVLRQGDWKAHAFFLAARYPEEWQPKKPQSQEGKKLARLSRGELRVELQKRIEMLDAMPQGEEEHVRPILVVDNNPPRKDD